MNYGAKKAAVQCFLSASLLAFTTCSTINTDDGGTQTGNPALAGVVYNQNGTRAVNAKVRIARWNTSPQDSSVIADSTVTNDTGGYAIDSLVTDTFNLLASSGVFLGYKDSITVKSDSTTLAPPCTLKAEGSVSGVVQLENNGDVSTVFILFMGTNTFVTPSDSIGNFTASNLAEGRYAVKILTTLPNYDSPLDTSFTITAGVEAALPDTLWLRYSGIPVPQGLRIVYDTMKQIVTLYWNTPTTGVPLSGYNIYRKHQDSSGFELIKAVWPDTTYNDSTGIQDITYEYRVAAVDTSTTEGTRSAGKTVQILSAYILRSSIDSINGVGIKPFGLFTHNDHLYIADGWAKKIWETDLTGNFISQFGSVGSDSGKFMGPADIAIDTSGSYWIADFLSNRIQKLDSNRNFVASWSWVKNISGDSIQIVEPWKLAINDSNKIYILYNSVDWQIARIEDQGTLLGHWQLGSNEFAGIAVDHQGRIVAWSDSLHLSLFAPTGALVGTILLSEGKPGGIAIDSAGFIYVHNSSGTISIYDANGLFQARWQVQGDAEGDMAVAPSGEVFLGSLWPGKIQIFTKR